MINIQEIKFGKIDAHNELQELGYNFYLESFLKYDKYKINSFLNGENYFIYGDKGTGKTALLKYFECTLSEVSENLIIPIRFKSQFDTEDKKIMNQTAANVHEEVIEDVNIAKTTSYILIWQVYIINQIIKNIDTGEYHVFQSGVDYDTIKKLLSSIYEGQTGKVVPKLTKGYLNISASSLKGLSAELKLDIEFDEKTNKINFSKTAKVILNLYKKLIFDTTPTYILVDELELSVKTKKEYMRDIQLIRDLVIAVDQLNNISKEKSFNIKFLASIRTDVINNVLSYGYEINKSIEDFGVRVEWFQKGGSYKDSPLLKLVENKIHASENLLGLAITEDVWAEYFDDEINNTETRKYILSYTWQRPRDIIRMMKFVQDQCSSTSTKFTQEMFDKAMQQYSERAWGEISEELALAYTDKNDLIAIKKFFTGISVPFTFKELNTRVEELSVIYEYIDEFFKKYKMVEFLENMFKWGVIGNSGSRMIFKFLGDNDLSLSDPMIIHRPLRNFFAVKSNK